MAGKRKKQDVPVRVEVPHAPRVETKSRNARIVGRQAAEVESHAAAAGLDFAAMANQLVEAGLAVLAGNAQLAESIRAAYVARTDVVRARGEVLA